MIIELTSFPANNSDDYKAALEIRSKVFVQEQQIDKFFEFDSYDLSAAHYLVKVDGESAATGRWRETDEGIKIEKLSVLKNLRGFGYGYMLLKTIIQEVKLSGQKVYLYSKINETDLYKAAGFAEEGDLFFDNGIEHISMKLK